MSLHLWAPQRPHPLPMGGAVASVTTHLALLATIATVGGPSAPGPDRAGSNAGGDGGAPRGERVHWIGIVPAATGTDRAPTAEGSLPIAYVVPGRGALRVVPAGTPPIRTARTNGGALHASAGGGALPPSDALPQVRRVPRARTAHRLPLPVLPDLVPIDADAMLLVSGVVSVAPDFTRRVSRPDDFVPPRSGAGQRPGSLAQALALERMDTRLDELPVPMVNNPPPRYPFSLERAHVGGRVVVEFVIDSTGAVDVASLRVLQSTNRLFTEAVQRVMPRLRFLPAQLQQHAVGALVRQPFVFTVERGR